MMLYLTRDDDGRYALWDTAPICVRGVWQFNETVLGFPVQVTSEELGALALPPSGGPLRVRIVSEEEYHRRQLYHLGSDNHAD